MRIAVIGAGIAGLTAASLLQRRHDINVLEANDYVGGHTNTIDVVEDGRGLSVDTGFIVFNETNYPNLCRMFDRLGVEVRETDMSFSVRCDRSGLEYNGSTLDRLFVQRRNLLRPAFWSMLVDIVRFHRRAPMELADGLTDETTVAQYLAQRNYGAAFVEQYLVPLGAALWSCSATRFREFPMRFVIEFLHNHRMLQISGRPRWKTVVGGSREYVRLLTADFAARIRTRTVVTQVRRVAGGVELALRDGRRERFDEVVLAAHADQSLALVSDSDAVEEELLRAFPYQNNDVVLHTDTAMLPRSREAWASWNYRVPRNGQAPACVTYNMNMLQGLDSARTYCVSLNQSDDIEASRVIRRLRYAHPAFGPGRAHAQARHAELVRRRGISYCGAYWGYGFHEDGVRSALTVCDGFGIGVES